MTVNSQDDSNMNEVCPPGDSVVKLAATLLDS